MAVVVVTTSRYIHKYCLRAKVLCRNQPNKTKPALYKPLRISALRVV